jgi:hypothetical protein
VKPEPVHRELTSTVSNETVAPDDDVIDAELVDDEEKRVIGLDDSGAACAAPDDVIEAEIGTSEMTVRRDLAGATRVAPESDDDQGHRGWHRG